MKEKRFHIIIASVIFASVTWLAVNMRNDYTVTRHLPVVIERLKPGASLKFPVPKEVTVRLRGSGWLLAGLSLTAEIKYFIDVSSLNKNTYIITDQELPEHVKLPGSVQLVDVQPDTLLLALDEFTEKRVPVAPRVVLSYHEGYGQVGSLHVSPDSVTVTGSAAQLAFINEWRTVYKRLADLTSPVDVRLEMEESPSISVTLLERFIRLHANVQPFAEKIFPGVPLTAIGAPANREPIFVPPGMDITARGGIDQLARLSASDFSVNVRFDELISDTLDFVTPTVSAPSDVTIVGRRPERFRYIVRKRL